MKVLFLTNIPSPYRVDFFQQFGKYCELTVLYELPRAADRDKTWGGEGDSLNYTAVYLKPVVRKKSSAWCPSVKKYLKEGLYDIIIVGGYSTPTGMEAIRCLKKRKLRYLINCDGGFAATHENPIKYRLKKYLLSNAAGWLSSGKLADEYLLYYGAQKEKIYRYPFTSLREEAILAACPTTEEKLAQKRELHIAEEKMILSVGQFIPRKGFDILLEAAPYIEGDCGIYIVGGQATEEYLHFTEKYGLRHVHFLPFMESVKLQKYYVAADLFVSPTREDIWGLVINEAMAAGLPVITTARCAAGVELLEKACIVPQENADALAKAMNRFLEDDGLRRREGLKNLEKIRGFTIEKMAEAHRDIIRIIQSAAAGNLEK